MSSGDDLMITLETDAGHAIEDVNELQRSVKDLNAELEYTLDLLDELKEHEYGVKPTDPRLRNLGKRVRHADTDDDYYDNSSGDGHDGPDVGADNDDPYDLSGE